MDDSENYLGGIDWSRVDREPRLPHQMSPEEFRAHPLAVHHGSVASFPADTLGTPKYNFQHKSISFAGSMLQAKDIINATGELGRGGTIHHYWAVPNAHEAAAYYDDDHAVTLELGGKDIQGRKASDTRISKKALDESGRGLGYYRNIVEGRPREDYGRYSSNPFRYGTASVVMANPDHGDPKVGGFVTQSEYVREAIAQGFRHEVHPRTLALYKNGTLDSTEVSSDERVKNLGRTGFISPQFIYNREYYGDTVPREGGNNSPNTTNMTYDKLQEFNAATNSKIDRVVIPREKRQAVIDNKPINLGSIRRQVKSGYTDTVRNEYGRLYSPPKEGH